MSGSIVDSQEAKQLFARAAGLDGAGGNERLKRIVQRITTDLCRTVEEFDVTPTEFWTAVGYLTRLGQANEAGLLVAGSGIEHFLDLLVDEKERRAGLEGGTPRTIVRYSAPSFQTNGLIRSIPSMMECADRATVSICSTTYAIIVQAPCATVSDSAPSIVTVVPVI